MGWPDCFSTYGKTNLKCGQNLLVADQIKRSWSKEDYSPFSCLAFPLATELIYPVGAVAGAAVASFTDIRQLPS